MKGADETSNLEVLYTEGATPLFLAIEKTDWRQALDLIEADASQVRTWIRSKGTENTTFAWSMWRRLPIHEVCFLTPMLPNFTVSLCLT